MKFSILLHVEKDDPCFQVYNLFGRELQISGHTFLEVSCDQLDSDALYVRIRLDAPQDKLGLVVWVPHRYVVFVFADDQDRKIGFWDS
jgi:hypothetical protein